MALPTSRQELIDHCKAQLGEPAIKVNVTPEQWEVVVDDALQFWQEYHENGTERTFLKVVLTQTDIDNGYVVVPENVQAIIKVIPSSVIGTGSNNFMSFQYQFNAASVWDLVQFGNASGYFIVNQYLAEMSMLLGEKSLSRFRQSTGRLYLDTDMGKFSVGDYLIAECYAFLDPDTYTALWGNRLLRSLTTAYGQRVWGNNLRKFQNLQLPSGIVLNGDAIYESAVRDIEKYEQEIRNHNVPVAFVVA
jgi:hypothetical protein